MANSAGAATNAASITTASTASTSSSGSYTPYDDEYRTVINVADAGADTSGGESITPILNAEKGDDTLFYFPPGRYAMDSQFRFTNFDRFGVVGEEATIVPANVHNFDGPQYRLFRLGTGKNPGKNVRFEGFRIDQTAEDTGIRAIEVNASDKLEVANIQVDGFHDSGTWGPGRFNMTDSDGVGRVFNFRAEDGGAWNDETPSSGTRKARGPVGIVANTNEGQLMFQRCHLGPFPGTGLYAANGSGRIIVRGGRYWNSTAANIRIGGTNSVVRCAEIVVDESNGRDTGQRGIRLEGGDVTVSGAEIRMDVPRTNCHAITVMNNCPEAQIENTKIEVEGDAVNHGIVVSPGAGETHIVGTKIIHEASGGYPLWIRDSDNDDRVLGEYLAIEGEAGDEAGFRDGIRCERDNVRFEECKIEQNGRDGADRNGITNTGGDFSLYRTSIRASQYPLIEQGTDSSFLRIDAESYDDSNEAICLFSSSSGTKIRHSRIANGIRDFGSNGLVTYSNDE